MHFFFGVEQKSMSTSGTKEGPQKANNPRPFLAEVTLDDQSLRRGCSVWHQNGSFLLFGRHFLQENEQRLAGEEKAEEAQRVEQQ